ncbi:tyrosine-type recombinase/integrase [Leptothoe sp. LEGE 181152]|nr:tyrosine-type recombinase/integrase [Leptothoe sp. LEGE 181152]
MNRQVTPKQLYDTWLAYAEFRRPVVSPSTYIRDYLKVEKRILTMMRTKQDLNDSHDMREWLLTQFSVETARRTLQQWNAAFKWAVAMDKCPRNPFCGLAKYLNHRRQLTEGNYTAFTNDERAKIIKAFEEKDPYYSNWVWFLFFTGCRPEEASALRWENVAHNNSYILIKEARPIDTGLIQPTKTYQATKFPCNAKMQAFLAQLRETSDSRWVLPSIKGNHFDYRNFQTRHWRPLITSLVCDRKVAFRLGQYHCRHTFITEMLKAGVSDIDVSYLCRVSIPTIQRYYISQSRQIQVPEI